MIRDADGSGEHKVKVLHLITRLILGGAQENTIASVAYVDPERFESHLWMGPQTGSEGSLLEEARRLGIKPRILPDLVRELNPIRDLRIVFELSRLFRQERFDIIHTHSSKAGIVGRIAAKMARVPSVVHTVHGWGFHERMTPSRRRFYVVLEKWMARWTDRLVSVSERTTRIGLEHGIGEHSHYSLIRSGIPVEQFRRDPRKRAAIRRSLGIADNEIVIGSVGRLSPQKNPTDFVRIASRLANRYPKVRFIYVGGGPLRAEIEDSISAAGLMDRITLLGLRRDIADILSAFDIFILTSLWEGLPRVVPQALASGLPVIAYDISGIKEIIRPDINGELVRSGDTGAMEEILANLVTNDSLRSELSARAERGFDSSFSEDRMIRDLESLYSELAGMVRGNRDPVPADSETGSISISS